MISFQCPACKKGLRAPDKGAGASLPCPACKTTVIVPAGTSPPAADAPPPAASPAPIVARPVAARPREAAAVEADDGQPRPGWAIHSCPGCRTRLRSPAADARMKVVCPGCRQVGTVPPPMTLARASGRKAGYTQVECSQCRVRLEVATAELGGVGPCPSCGYLNAFLRDGLLRRGDRARRPDEVAFLHTPCRSAVVARREDAGAFTDCPICRKPCRVPRWASIRQDDGSRRDDGVYWRCGSCGTDVQSDTRFEAAYGACPGCDGSLEVPRRGRTEPAGTPRDGWQSASCNGCGAGFQYPADDAGGIAVCPGCKATLALPEAAAGGRPGPVAAAVGELATAFGLDLGNQAVARALGHLVGTAHPAVGAGGTVRFAEVAAVCDAVLAACPRTDGKIQYLCPADLLGGHPINLVYALRVAVWKGWHPRARLEGHLDTGSPHLDEVVFQERALRAYPAFPANQLKGAAGHRVVKDPAQQPGMKMLLLPGLYKCPSCQRGMAYIYEGTVPIDAARHTEGRMMTDAVHRDAQGYVVGTTQRWEQVTVATVKTVNLFRCRHCDHLWGEVGEKRGDIG